MSEKKTQKNRKNKSRNTSSTVKINKRSGSAKLKIRKPRFDGPDNQSGKTGGIMSKAQEG